MTDRIERSDPKGPSDGIRPTWSHSSRLFARRIVQPLQSFLETETSSAILLLAATVLALLWANSPVSGSYGRFWGTELTIGFGDVAVSDNLRGWVSDGLMTLFFFVVGLEIKRELLTGELRQRRAAVLPVVAAIGGMLVPAAVYVAFTAGTASADGFGIAMPTDVVFALSVLALAGRAPPGLKALLLTLAIVDDLGSVVVVALAYSEGIKGVALVSAVALFAAFALCWRIHIRAVVVYVLLGLAAWVALGEAGVSPTIAGVVLAFLTPAAAFQRPKTVSQEAHRVADQTVDEPEPPDADAAHWLYLAGLSREAVSPLARAEAFLLPWSSYIVVPVFALAFAGIDLSGDALTETATSDLGLGILVSRLVGKPLGIALAVLVALRVGATLPEGVRGRHVVGLGAAAGIPFTVSLYISQISLPAGRIETATVAIVLAALVSGLTGFLVLRTKGRR